MINVYIGFDKNEVVAYNVLAHSIQEWSSVPVSITPINVHQLRWIFKRERVINQSTDFSFSRFLVPFLSGYEGWSIFMDCDFLCLDDIHNLWKLRDERYAVQVCKHDHVPTEEMKFLGQMQTKYEKKNWSSLIMFNNKRCQKLTPKYVNTATGLDLHQFRWLDGEHEIGEIPIEWNYLVGYYPKKEDVHMVHYTEGGPYFNEYRNCDYSREWNDAYKRMTDCAQTADIRKVS